MGSNTRTEIVITLKSCPQCLMFLQTFLIGSKCGKTRSWSNHIIICFVRFSVEEMLWSGERDKALCSHLPGQEARTESEMVYTNVPFFLLRFTIEWGNKLC